MQETTVTIQTTDGIEIHTVAWLPDTAPRAVIMIAHGIGEHSGRYRHVAAYLVEQGYAVHALDHRGHGKSGGERVYFESFDVAVNDLKQVIDTVKAQHTGLPMILMGHSMGSLITLLFALKYQSDLAGVISSGTPLTLETTVPSFVASLLRMLERIMPRAKFIAVDPNDLSHDPQVIADYKADPLTSNDRINLRMVAGLVNNAQHVRDNLHTLTLPLLILHGEADALAPKTGSDLLYAQAASTDKTLKIYPNLYHETLNEPEKQTVLDDIGAWLEGQFPPA